MKNNDLKVMCEMQKKNLKKFIYFSKETTPPNYKLNRKCIELSEKIDEESKSLRKPLLISTSEYNEKRIKLYDEIEGNEKLKIENNEENEIEIINENETLEYIIYGNNN